MSRRNRPPTSHNIGASTSTGRRSAGRPETSRPGTARPRTSVSTIARIEAQQVVCAVTESRGISPTVGLAFVNLDTGEAVLCQICDSQTYVRTVHKLRVYGPTEILIVATASSPKSKLYSIIEENLEVIGSTLTLLDRRYWAESTGLEYIQSLAFLEDVEAFKISVSGNYYAVCSIAAVIKFIELGLNKTFPIHSLRFKYETSEGSMMVDISTIYSLELVQNLQNQKSADCLFGLLNETQTPMGSRLLRSNILQPTTEADVLNTRYDAVQELALKEETFFATRAALKRFLDIDKVLTALIVIPINPTIDTTEQSINQVIMLKQFVNSVKPIHDALTGVRSSLLSDIRELCSHENVQPVQNRIDAMINEDTTYAKQPLELRNQRTYAVKSGINGLLDVARVSYKEASEDAYKHSTELGEEYDLPLDLKYDPARQFYIVISKSDLGDRPLPPVFTNILQKKKHVECQTLELMKRNHKITISHQEIVLMSDDSVQALIEEIRSHMSILFKICEAVAMLDMISAFAHLVTINDYVRPVLADVLEITSGRHPIREKIMRGTFISNDVYAANQSRFQIITGCNMSGKSTYIRSVALMSIMAQIGSFVPAKYASFPIRHQLFARLGMDDNIETNVSTFAAEMREIASILHNIDKRSLAVIDELGRGTSTRDGLAIALAIAEALVDSKALVWFATHFKDIATILAERSGVTSFHLAVDIRGDDTMTMLYRVAKGVVTEPHYGLALAKVVPLPEGLIEHATYVAKKLERQNQKRKRTSAVVIKERRRKLVLDLKEHLIQTQKGELEGDVLSAWLKALQNEFVTRMSAIDAEEARSMQDSEEEEEDVDMDQVEEVEDEEMRKQSAYGSQPEERPITYASQPSIVTISSRVSTSESPSTVRAVSESMSDVRAVSENYD
ncbi:hypothetical protein K504DRAFT_481523 [Pleomassaria siparia CBS 279.74]|uniref:DNA mismatch repair proteins mutS family domain-containing protein n=1 Tax=Pleomassaria siparia CBS 279.74 TaxID=1314801 RepID=A0A6G1KC52_9PLEO|nr:hypothetical protein K504DRAFT_481523 [Pleomassaria siparia CBS 279.74]